MNTLMNKSVMPLARSFSALRPSLAEKTVDRSDCINIFASMPCPLKVPFQQVVQPFVEQWNANTSHKPLFLAKDSGCSSDDNFDPLANPNALPDIFIASAPNLLFSERFRRKLIDTNLYGGFPSEYYSNQYSPNIIEAASRLKVGFLGFSSWGIVRDITVRGYFPVPNMWTDLTTSNFKGLLAIHGCHGHAGNLALFLHLKKRKGEAAISLFADNIEKARHFSELIKSLNTERSKTPYYILPYSAIAQIPSVKQIEIMPINDSIITPMMLVAKQSNIEAYKGVLEFFTGAGFRNMLTEGAYLQPDDVAGLSCHNFDDLDMLSSSYYENSEPLMHQFVKLLGNKMGNE